MNERGFRWAGNYCGYWDILFWEKAVRLGQQQTSVCFATAGVVINDGDGGVTETSAWLRKREEVKWASR